MNVARVFAGVYFLYSVGRAIGASVESERVLRSVSAAFLKEMCRELSVCKTRG